MYIGDLEIANKISIYGIYEKVVLNMAKIFMMQHGKTKNNFKL